MKKLYLMRHSKSDWSDVSLGDFERGLNKRGFNDAILMGKVLKSKGAVFDLVFSSAAKRAELTAVIVSSICRYDVDNIKTKESLYLCGTGELKDAIKNLPKSADSVLITAHNPTCEEFMEELGFNIEKFPTSAVALIEFKTKEWQESFQSKRKLKFFIYPKKLKYLGL